jgi:hypothetical protein
MRRNLAMLIAVALGCGGPAAASASDAGMTIPTEWLQQKVGVAEAEAAHPGIADERVNRFPDAGKPFGYRHREWQQLKAEMRAGDELWTFASPPDSWKHLAGRAGVALVRNGTPVRIIVTMMN